MKNTWAQAFSDAQKVLQILSGDRALVEKCESFGNDLVTAFQGGKKILICGNGGSHCDALHFAEEFTGRYRKERAALPVLALGDAAHTTCVGNDYGFEKIFSRQIEAFGHSGDLLVCLSTSGNSANVLEALNAAKAKKLQTWCLLGKGGGKAAALSKKSITVPGETSDRIQELHMLILHVAIEHVERALFPENYR